MIPTFVIGLREGLEAALIVGIIAAFLRKQGRRDLLRWVFIGVGVAILLCVAAGVALNVLSKDLPQRQQEGLETVIGALAVGMVTYMVVWMKRHSRELKGQLEGMAADAMGGASGAARAMVLMAFLAVLREGVETVVFLLAAFNQSDSGSSAAVGAVIGIAVAVLLGYGIYRGGVRINLSKFFRATGLILVFVAAGIVVNAVHTAHEAGWLNSGQGRTIDLTWLVDPGSVQASLLTGMLGLQSRPVVVEVIGWLVYLVPVGAYVAWPPGRSVARRTVLRTLLASGAALAVATVALAVAAPSEPPSRPATGPVQVVSASGASIVVQTADGRVRLAEGGTRQRGSLTAVVYSAHRAGSRDADLPGTLSYERIAALNGGRLPIGLTATGRTSAAVHYTDTSTVTAWVDPRTQRVLDLRSREIVTAAVVEPGRGALALSRPVVDTTTGLPATVTRSAAAAAAADRDAADRRAVLTALAWGAGVLAAIALLAAVGLGLTLRRTETVSEPTRVADLVNS